MSVWLAWRYLAGGRIDDRCWGITCIQKYIYSENANMELRLQKLG
jgi:hypothetical protein